RPHQRRGHRRRSAQRAPWSRAADDGISPRLGRSRPRSRAQRARRAVCLGAGARWATRPGSIPAHRAGRIRRPAPAHDRGRRRRGAILNAHTPRRSRMKAIRIHSPDGPGVTEVKVGDKVAYTGVPGAYAQYAAVPAARLVVLPQGVSTKQGAAIMLQGMTAHYLACSTYPLKKGDTCLVHAAAGGVGLILCQIARLRGARVIGTVSTDEKAKLAREAGAEETILYTKQDFAAETKRITGGKGVQVAYDSVGKDTWEGSLNSCAIRGMIALYGKSSGPIGMIDSKILNAKGELILTPLTLFHLISH